MTSIKPPDFNAAISTTQNPKDANLTSLPKNQAIPFSEIAKSSNTVGVDQVLSLGPESPTADSNPVSLDAYLPIPIDSTNANADLKLKSAADPNYFVDDTTTRPATIQVNQVTLPVIGQTTPVTLRVGDNLGKIFPLSESSNQVNTRFGLAEREQLDNGNYGYLFPERQMVIITRPDNTVERIIVPNSTPQGSGSGI